MNNRFIPLLLLAFLLLGGCASSSTNNGILADKLQDSMRIVEYQYDSIILTRMDNINAETTFLFIGSSDTINLNYPDITIDWSISHEMTEWIILDKNNVVAVIPQIGLGTMGKASNSLVLMGYEDCWQLNMADYEKSVWCIGTCDECSSGELINYETRLTKQHFPHSMVSAIPINKR